MNCKKTMYYLLLRQLKQWAILLLPTATAYCLLFFAGCNKKSPAETAPAAPVIEFAQASYTFPAGAPATVTGTVKASNVETVKCALVTGSAETALSLYYPNSAAFDFAQTFTPTTATTGFKVTAKAKGGVETSSITSITIANNNGEPPPPEPPATTTVAAFPGAEGFGQYATGGRGGKVIYVTNLTDNNTQGSLRWAINQSGARIVLFKVSGIIALNSKLSIKNPNITIAGQTAPGDGICIRNYPVSIDADNVVIRYLRFRMGDVTNTEDDALGGRNHSNIIIDHCSMSWSTDECVSFYSNRDFTLQWCIISESLCNSVHDKGAHGYGGIWGGTRASFHHNLLAHHDSRNPRLGETGGDVEALTDLVDLRNNVIYNWGGNSAYGGEAMNVNIVNCFYKPGPASSNPARILSIDKYQSSESSAIYNRWGKFYVAGNYMLNKDGTPNTRVIDDNWIYGVANQFHSKYGTVPQAELDAMRLATPHPVNDNVTTHTAQEACEKVLAGAGASLARDATDTRIVDNVRNGDYSFPGSNGSKNGIIDSQADVGGWDTYNSADAPVDTDNDGMPDAWEDARGLNKNNAADGVAYTLSQTYTNVEIYINGLVEN